MPAFTLPVVVRTADGDIDLLIDLPAPTALAVVLPAVLAGAGLAAGTSVYLGAGRAEGSLLLGRPPLLAGCVLATFPDDTVDEAGTVALSCVAGPDAGGSVALSAGGVMVGRDPGCDLSAADPELSRRHARIRPSAAGAQVLDLDSVNGIRVDGAVVGGARVDEVLSEAVRPEGGRGDERWPGTPTAALEVPFDALLRLGGSVFRLGFVSEQRLLLTPDDQGRLAVSRPARVSPGFLVPLAEPPGPTPVRSRRPIPVLSALIGAAAGAAIALLTGLWMFLLLAALGPVMMVAGGVSDRISGARSHRRMVADHRQATKEHQAQLVRAVAADRADAWDRYPDPATLRRRAGEAGIRLWERRPGDADFLRVTLGAGTRPARLPVPAPPPVVEAPITLDLAGVGVLGLTGDCRSLLRWLLAQLVTLHSPADLRLAVFSGQPDLARTADLPHAGGEGSPGLCSTVDQAGAEIARLLATLRAGPPDDGRGDAAAPVPPVTVLVLDDAHRWRRLPGMGALLALAKAGSRSGGAVVAICLSAAASGLPLECAAVAATAAGRLRTSRGDEVTECEPTGVSASYLRELTGALTPLYDRDAIGGGLPGRVLLSEVGNGDLPARLVDGWQRPSMTAVLGTDGAGPLEIDLERDGPHVLIAGTTGAGKSELLQTLVVGLALAAAPDRTSFLLLDYKGGAAFGRLAELPHTTAVVTDLDPATASRALTGLRAEVRRRERLLAQAGVADLATLRRRAGSTTDGRTAGARPTAPVPTNPVSTDAAPTRATPTDAAPTRATPTRPTPTDAALTRATPTDAAWTDAASTPPAPTPPPPPADGGPGAPAVPPSLVIVVDEYATLGAELPDFLVGLLDVAQRGRSLGLHLVLATQRPAGVLSPAMKANIALRICLRVEDAADSMDVLDTAAAAELSAAHPGRALLRRDRGRVTMFQVATVSAAARRTHRVRRRDGGCPPDPNPDRPTDVDAVIAAARAAAGGARPVPPWLPALPLHYRPADDDVIGLLDEPARQRQRTWPLPAASMLVVGPPGSGRSTVLRRIGWSAAAAGADLLVVDTGGKLADLAGWPAVRSHLDARDPVLVQRLLRRVVTDLRCRADRSGPPLVLLLDDWDVLGPELDALDFGISTAAVGEAAAHGPPLGMRLGVAGDLRVQHHRMAPGFGVLLRLGVDVRGEVAPLPAGRGRWQDTEVHCAQPPPDRASPGDPTESRVRTDIVVRPLPVEVSTGQLPTARPDAVPIGLGGDDAAPACLDLTGPGGGLLVAGPRRSGVSGALDVLAVAAAAAGIRVVRACLRPSDARHRVQDVDVRHVTAELADLLVAHTGPLLLVADDADSWPDREAGLLERFLLAAGSGQYLALGCRLDRAVRAHRGPVAEVAALRTGVLLGADAADGALLGTVLPRRRGAPPPGRGHLVIDGVADVVQVARIGTVPPETGDRRRHVPLRPSR